VAEIVRGYGVETDDGHWICALDSVAGLGISDSGEALQGTSGVGTGLTGLKGMVKYVASIGMHQFTPVCCVQPTISSTGNVLTPIELTYEEFYTQCYYYTGTVSFESMLVRVTTPMIAFDDYGLGYTTWEHDYYDLATSNAKGATDYFIVKYFDANYIGDEIPTDPTIYQGIRINLDWGAPFGLMFPRSKDDIIKVTGPIIIADPDPANINGVLPGQCKSTMITIYNEGIGNAEITALYLDDSPGTDEFNIVDPLVVPFDVDTWESFEVEVEFCPLDNGAESTTLLVEYGVGQILEVPINGTTVLINTTPFCEGFNTSDWYHNATNLGWTNNLAEQDGIVEVGWFSASARIGDGGYTMYIYPYNNMVTWTMTPGFVIDEDNLWLQFFHGALDGFNNGWGTADVSHDPRRVLISDDNQATWTEIWSTTADQIPERVAATNFAPWAKTEISLADYAGKTVFFKFQSHRTGAPRGYWIIEDVCIAERITEPIIDAPASIDFGGVQVGESATTTVTIKNKGASVLKVTGVALEGDGFTLVDNNTYPVEVEGAGVAYSVNGADAVNVDVTLTPDDIGIYTGKLTVYYGYYEAKTFEISLTGEGLSCYTAAEAQIGENYFYQNSWWKYTAEKFQLVTVNSCSPHQDLSADQSYGYDTWLYVYADCEGTLIGENDDMTWETCPYNRPSSEIANIALNEGESIYIFWPLAFTDAAFAYDEMVFNIIPAYPIDGDVCETAIPLTLPVVNMFGSTVEFADDYDASPCSPYSNYMDGNDVVYKISLPNDGYLTASILGAYGSIHVLDKCPKEELLKENCKAFVGGPNGGPIDNKRIQAGDYFVIVSTWAPPQTVDFLLNMSFADASGVDDNSLTNNLSVYPNPTNSEFTVSVTQAEVSDLTIELVNISGQVVYRLEEKSVYSLTEKIDVREFAKGVYYLKVNNGTEIQIEKVVVQ
jgi:hypothetical protein